MLEFLVILAIIVILVLVWKLCEVVFGLVDLIKARLAAEIAKAEADEAEALRRHNRAR